MVMQDPRASNDRSQNSFPQTFKDLTIKGLIYCLALRSECFLDNSSRIIKDDNHELDSGFADTDFVGWGDASTCHSALCRCVSKSYSNTHASSPVFTRSMKLGSVNDPATVG
ncbi:hypothetical protein Trydic_g21442 [Trypoxylus dichotomus]